MADRQAWPRPNERVDGRFAHGAAVERQTFQVGQDLEPEDAGIGYCRFPQVER